MRAIRNFFSVLFIGIFTLVIGCNSKPVPMKYEDKRTEVQKQIEEFDSTYAHNVIDNRAALAYSIDSLLKKMRKLDQFNGNILVAYKGNIIYQNAVGWANPSEKDSLNLNSMFQLASVSKTVTSTAVLLLYEQRYFKLDDKFTKYFPDFPYKNVTIKQLLNHRSGLPNYLYFNERFYPSNKIYLTNEDVYEVMVNKRIPPMFHPGARFFYNNTNYALLALLVERVSGRSYANYVQKNIFDLIGMRSSHVELPDEFWYRENKTYGLYPNNRKYGVDRFDGVFGDKGVYSNLEDMYLFNKALYPDVLLKESTLEEAFQNYVTEPRRIKQYGLGFRIKCGKDSCKIIYHNGWWHGYRTAFHRRPSDQSCVIVLSNRLNRSVYSIVRDVFKIIDKNSDKEEFEEEE